MNIPLHHAGQHWWDYRGHAWADDGFGNLIEVRYEIQEFVYGERQYPPLSCRSRPIPQQYREHIRILMKEALLKGSKGAEPLVKKEAMTQPDWDQIVHIVIYGPYDDDLTALRAEVQAEIEREKK